MTDLAIVQPGKVSTGIPARTDDGRLRDACEQFGALFLSQVFKAMRDSIPENGIIPHSSGEKLFQEMLDNQYAATMSNTQTPGMAAMLYQQLRDQQVGTAK